MSNESVTANPAMEIVARLQGLAKDGGCRLTRTPANIRKWLMEKSDLPSELVRILCDSWPNDHVPFGPYNLWSVNQLSESERAKIAFIGGFFMVGSAGNGDLLVVRRRPDAIEECEIGLISHEQLWEKNSAIKSIYKPICRGFLRLLKEAEKGKLPLDYYATTGERKIDRAKRRRRKE